MVGQSETSLVWFVASGGSCHRDDSFVLFAMGTRGPAWRVGVLVNRVVGLFVVCDASGNPNAAF